MQQTRLTFADLADLEPRLGALEKLVKLAAPAADGDPDYLVFLTAVKPLVTSLVGWSRGWLDVRDTLERGDKVAVLTLGQLIESAPTYARPSNEVEDVLRDSTSYDTVYEHLNTLLG